MATCGECKWNVGGICKDFNKEHGEVLNDPVRNDSEACSDLPGWNGFTPKERVLPVKNLGQLLAEKIDNFEQKSSQKHVRNCGSCQRFKAPGERCGHSYMDMSGKQQSYTPMKGEVGPCQDGYVPKEEPPENTTCRDCILFKGKGERCGDGTHVARVLELKCSSFKLMAPVGVPADPLAPRPYKLAVQTAYIKTTPQKKETSIMSNAIVRLADSQFSKDVEDFGGLSLDLKDALEELQSKQKKEAATSAAQEVMRVLNSANTSIEVAVGSIQSARRQEVKAKRHIEEINKAKAYGLATNNFVPLAILVSSIDHYSVDNKELLKIDESKLPADWDKKPSKKQDAEKKSAE